MEAPHVRIYTGLRIGFWNHNANHFEGNAFRPLGFYAGPDLGEHIVGARLEQKLMEGSIFFSVGVLFRPDLSGKARLETILILENYIPEMWNYDTWEKTGT